MVLHEEDIDVYDKCIFCNKTIEQVGGRKIASSHFINIFRSDKYLGGGNPEYPYQSVKIDDEHYLVVKGLKSVWTTEAIEKALSTVRASFKPWFCQQCGNRTCSTCGNPSQYLHGVDLLNGAHCAVLPVPPGCINPECEKHMV